MRSVVAREARRVAIVRSGLEALLDAGEHGKPTSAVFAPELAARGEWVRRLMKRLEDRRLVRSFTGPRTTVAGPSHVTWYVAEPALRAAIVDDHSVAQLIWPAASAFYNQEEASPAEDGGGEASEAAGGDETASSTPVGATIAGTDRELLEAIVRLCAAIAPAVAGIRSDLQSLSKKLDELREAWE